MPHFHSRRRFLFLILIYSTITPFGLGMGFYIMTREHDIMTGVFLAISAGNLIYLCATKSIVEEFSISRLKIVKAIAFCLGILMVIFFHLNEVGVS